ncbi:hypothetical protein N0V82_010231 [Gnomoniopsis sp. IMI 355080]|nr:hypothetical protein N0V82_010231 [Gnomoniopsis sp. IMI 355080]
MSSLNETTAGDEGGYQRVRIMGKLTTQKGLHVDFGSSAMRCAYFYNHGDKMANHMIVRNDAQFTEEGEGIEGRHMEHSVDIYPFADGQPGEAIYPGNTPYAERRPVSAKYAIYTLVGMSDEIYSQYSLAADLDDHAQRDPTFKARLEQGVHELLVAVMLRAKAVAAANGDGSSDGLDTLTATIPAQWSIEFEKYYGDRLHKAFREAFKYPVGNILFHTEAQAGLQYMLYRDDVQAQCDRAELGDLMKIGDKSNIVLLFDVGGHATLDSVADLSLQNSALMSVCRDKDQKPFLMELEKDLELSETIYLTENNPGASGGTRAWEYELMRTVREMFHRQRGKDLTAKVENELRVHFYRIKDDIRENKATNLYAEDQDQNTVVFKLSWDLIHAAWTSAFRHTMTLITKQLKELQKRQNDYDVARVIVSGGSARHKIFRGFFESECRALGMEKPFYMTRISRDHEYARLALGASYATTKTPSVKEFLDSSSFGLRLKIRWRNEEGVEMYDWSKDILLMWSKAEGFVDIHHTCTTEEDVQAEIVCQPNFAAPHGIEYLPRENPAYRVLYLDRLPHDKTHFRLNFDAQSEDMTLMLMGEVRTTLSMSGMGEPRYPVLATASFPVTVWAGCRALTIYDDDGETKAKVDRLLATAINNYAKVRSGMAIL